MARPPDLHPPHNQRMRARPDDAAQRVSRLVEGVFTSIRGVRDEFWRICLAATNRQLRSGDLGELTPLLLRHLDSHAGLVSGIGVVVAPDLLADAPRWLEWWCSGPQGKPFRLQLGLDPDSFDFYDYASADWFAGPRRGSPRSIVGPYVDYSGANDYILTLSVPAHLAGTFLGIAGADLLVDELEKHLRPITQALRRHAVLVTAEGRIIASTSPRRFVGSLLRGVDIDEPIVTVPDGPPDLERVVRYPCPGLPWSLIVFP
jgi:hypothetical protein